MLDQFRVVREAGPTARTTPLRSVVHSIQVLFQACNRAVVTGGAVTIILLMNVDVRISIWVVLGVWTSERLGLDIVLLDEHCSEPSSAIPLGRLVGSAYP